MKLHCCMMVCLSATLALGCGGPDSEAQSPKASEGSSEQDESGLSDEEFWAQEAEATEGDGLEETSNADSAEEEAAEETEDSEVEDSDEEESAE